MQEILTASTTRPAAPALVGIGGEPCGGELMARGDASQSRMSRHMRDAGFLRDRRDAQWVRFRRNPDLAPESAAVIDAALTAEHCFARKAA